MFSKAGRLDLLQNVFGKVFIPQAVFEEVVTEGAGRPGSGEIANTPWIRLRSVAGHTVAAGLAGKVGRGEAEAIALAQELGEDIPLLIDDRLGRRLAREMGLTVVGSAGVLVQAKARRVIPILSPVLDELRSLGLYLSDAARHEILVEADEAPAAEVGEE